MGIITTRILEITRAITPPKLTDPLVEHTSVWIAQRLLAAHMIGGSMQRKALDSKYWTCTRLDFDAIIKWDWTDNKKYVAEKYDCENFAFSFKARMDRKFNLNNVGLVVDYSGSHAYNCVVFSDGTAELFEPQSDSFKTNQLGTGNYKCESGFIVI